MKVTVLVADDHPVVRSGLVALLTTDTIEVVGQAEDGAQAVSMAASLRPDVVLMDLRMPVMDGVEATRVLTAEGNRSRVLVLTTYESDEQILAAIEAGAAGYLLKAAPPEEIIAGVVAVAGGDAALSPSVAASLVVRVRQAQVRPAERPGVDVLTAREREVLLLVAAGRTNRQIARDLVIGEATVKSHLLRVFAKLDVSDRTRAVTRAQELDVL